MTQPGAIAHRRLERGRLARFIALTVAYWALALLALTQVPAIEEFGIRLTLATVAGTFSLAGQPLVRSGNNLSLGGHGLAIVGDCGPHVPFLLFAAVVLAFPSRWRPRLLGLALGAAVILAFNTLRIAALILMEGWKPEWFEFVHVYLWQTGTVLVLVAAFVLWLRVADPLSAPRPRRTIRASRERTPTTP